MRPFVVLTLCLLSLLMSGVVRAEHSLTFSVGHFGVKSKDSTPEPEWYGLEYRLSPIKLWSLVPSFGYARGGAGAYYIYHDLGREFPFADNRMYIRLSSGPGYYRGERLRDLGHKIEFRSGIELGYRAANGLTIGAAIYHLSNTKLSSKNPGVEYATLNITFPFN